MEHRSYIDSEIKHKCQAHSTLTTKLANGATGWQVMTEVVSTHSLH